MCYRNFSHTFTPATVKCSDTQKPEKLLENIVLSSTKMGDIVLDCFFGTGTTGSVSKKLSRNYIGIEKEKEYFEISEQRIKTTAPLSEFFA